MKQKHPPNENFLIRKSSKPFYQKILNLALDIKAFAETVYDLRQVSAEMDYVVLVNGNSTMHIHGISENVEIQLKKQKIYALGTEGKKDSTWILMDYNEVVLHIFTDGAREHYNLDEVYQKYFKAKQINL